MIMSVKKIYIAASLGFFAFLVIAVSIFYMQYTKRSNSSIIASIGTLIELPKEEVKIATVTNKQNLNKDLFNKAENGDVVLIYDISKKIIIYRPSTKKIVSYITLN